MKHSNLLIVILSIFIVNSCLFTKDKSMQEKNTMEETTATIVRDTVFTPQGGVCSKEIRIHTENGIVMEVEFTKGCPGNTHGVAALIKGMTIEEAVQRLEGITCGNKNTSCPDQLAQALKALKE